MILIIQVRSNGRPEDPRRLPALTAARCRLSLWMKTMTASPCAKANLIHCFSCAHPTSTPPPIPNQQSSARLHPKKSCPCNIQLQLGPCLPPSVLPSLHRKRLAQFWTPWCLVPFWTPSTWTCGTLEPPPPPSVVGRPREPSQTAGKQDDHEVALRCHVSGRRRLQLLRWQEVISRPIHVCLEVGLLNSEVVSYKHYIHNMSYCY